MLKVNIVGIGPGNPDLLTEAAKQAVREANILIGDKRMLAAFDQEGKKVYTTIKTQEIADLIKQKSVANTKVATASSSLISNGQAVLLT